MPSVTRSRKSKAGKANELSPPEPFRVPYFAHQSLDPAFYPEEIGLPVGGPAYAPVNVNQGWIEPDESEDDFIDDEEMSEVQQATRNNRTRRNTDSTEREVRSSKRLKVSGGRPAVAKKVTADLDSDDELLVRMKEAKYLEKDIARILAEQGRIAYNAKTIGTRWARIKRVLQQRQDELLDAEKAVWHEGDDDVLYRAIEKADELVLKAKEAADAKKWRIVADEMKALKPVVNFSQNACRLRHEALEAGEAKPVPESIVNPDDNTKALIQARAEKERRILQDSQRQNPIFIKNLGGNAWTSKPRTYF